MAVTTIGSMVAVTARAETETSIARNLLVISNRHVMAGIMATVVIPTDVPDIVITMVTGSPWQRFLQAPL